MSGRDSLLVAARLREYAARTSCFIYAEEVLTLRGAAKQLDELCEVRRLVAAAHTYLDRFVDPHDALLDGFDVEAWCERVEELARRAQ